jgi:sensor c-di-GMP phosphodiesterase-like protein
MKRSLKMRALVTLAATVVAALCGALAGGWAGREVVLRQTAARLRHMATLTLGDSVAYSIDAHTVLDAMNASRAPFCSQEDLDAILLLVYQSRFLKEAGRIRDGKVACSTTLGRLHLPNVPQPKPDFIGADGVKVLQDPPLFRLSNVTVTSLQAVDSYIILNPFIYSLRDASGVHVKATVIDAAQGQPTPQDQTGPAATPPMPVFDNDFRFHDVLYSSRCSILYNTCQTASLSVTQALAAYRIELEAMIFVGGLAGGLFGFAASLFYRRKRGMEQQLRRAIYKDQLRVAYQPIVDLASQRILGAEALARWSDEDGVAIGPDIFVKIAEERGFVGEITKLVVRHVLREFAEVFRSHPGFHVSVNVAAADLADPEFLPMLEQALAGAGVPAESLIIEITETSTTVRQTAVETIRQLHRKGHKVHIDDFGTGYSSLSYLQDLSVDAIKIDKSFTQAIGTDAVTVSILPQVLGLAEALNLGVVVEGIETRLQAGYFSTKAQPILGQGWLFVRPVTAGEFQSLLAVDGKNETVSEEVPVRSAVPQPLVAA